MPVASITVASDTPTDPNAVPPEHVIDGPNGSAIVDPTKVPLPADKGAGERPAWLPEKFATPEAMAKAYAELETKQGKPAAPAAADVTPMTSVTPETAKAAGIDLTALSLEFSQNDGELTAETLKDLSDKGFDKAAVDGYIAGQQAIANQLTAKLEAVTGGKTELAATLEWAKTNLSAAEQAAYNAALDAGNVDLLSLTLQGIRSQYIATNGSDPKLIEGSESVRSTDAQPFGSSAEMVAIMKTEKYKNDPAYRAKIEARVGATAIFGIN